MLKTFSYVISLFHPSLSDEGWVELFVGYIAPFIAVTDAKGKHVSFSSVKRG